MAQAKIYWDLEMYQQVSHGIMPLRCTNNMAWRATVIVGCMQNIVSDEIVKEVIYN